MESWAYDSRWQEGFCAFALKGQKRRVGYGQSSKQARHRQESRGGEGREAHRNCRSNKACWWDVWVHSSGPDRSAGCPVCTRQGRRAGSWINGRKTRALALVLTPAISRSGSLLHLFLMSQDMGIHTARIKILLLEHTYLTLGPHPTRLISAAHKGAAFLSFGLILRSIKIPTNTDFLLLLLFLIADR